jgi:hypothetical protein
LKSIKKILTIKARRLVHLLKIGLWLIAREVDFQKYKARLAPHIESVGNISTRNSNGILIASGRGMNIVWAQIWTFLALSARRDIPNVYVISISKKSFVNRYFRLIGMRLIAVDKLIDDFNGCIPERIINDISNVENSEDCRKIYYDSLPIGDIALSTVCRHRGIGKISDFTSDVKSELQHWMIRVYKSYHIAKGLISDLNISHSFHTEVFLEEYGGIFFGCLDTNVKVLRFAGTVRDNAFIIQKLTNENARRHHASLNHVKWLELRQADFSKDMDAWLNTNFSDRYSEKWFRSKRNYPGDQIVDVELVLKELEISNTKPIAIVFSHILYDSIFFYGTDLYPDYETWLIETVRLACGNRNVQWIIKLHPSNVWRGEISTLLDGRTLEEKLLAREFPDLPSHVLIMRSESPVSALSLMKIAKFGVTVRGTSGLEMAALGKHVITAGTGRYEGCGFTQDPKSVNEYEDLIANLHLLLNPDVEATLLAKKYSYGVFGMKAFEITSLLPTLSFGKKTLVSSDDICYFPSKVSDLDKCDDLLEFLAFLKDDRVDLYSNQSFALGADK